MAFDIRADIAEIPLEEDTVDFTFDLKLAHQVKVLRAAADLDEAAIAEAEAALKAKTYTAELISVSRRQREDIYADSLDLFPAKPTMFGKDEKAEFSRGNYVQYAIVAAGIKRLINPQGEAQEEDILPAVEMIFRDAPEQIFTLLQRKTQELNTKADEQDALHKSADF